jgi:plasmid stabilization system protein ParE
MNLPPRVSYTKEARRDFDRCRDFLRRDPRANIRSRTRDFFNAVRRIAENPEINPVRKIDRGTGLQLRRCNVAQFVIVYVYFKSTAQEPYGLVSLRAFRHASNEDVLWGVCENTAEYNGTATLKVRIVPDVGMSLSHEQRPVRGKHPASVA